MIRRRGKLFPEGAYQFVRDGLSHTVQKVQTAAGGSGLTEGRRPGKHVTGQELCLGLRDLAIRRYGFLAGMVLTRWNLRKTEDFGVIVYSLIDQGEMKTNPDDRFEDFQGVYEFDEAFAGEASLPSPPPAPPTFKV
jgi:uncharacterized repeat protein (TIGR04138 family)